jgi:hypothetical protein
MSDQSTPSADPSERRQKVVMALGIVTIILFSANLLTVLAHHFWPDADWHVPFLKETETAAASWRIDVHSAPQHEHVFVFRQHGAAPNVVVQGNQHAIEMDLADLERQTRRMQRDLERELAAVHIEGIHFEAREQMKEAQAAVEAALQESAGSAFRVRVAAPDVSQN